MSTWATCAAPWRPAANRACCIPCAASATCSARPDVPIRRRLVLYAVGVATIGVTIFALVLTTLAARGVATNQDAALGRLAAATASSIQGLTPDALAGRQPLLPV